MKTVAIFGAGIAGLASAHEFTRLGYKVFVYEANREAGGFFRSARVSGHENMPSEYSWHGFGPWYGVLSPKPRNFLNHIKPDSWS